MYHYIYQITNIVNQKIYIGKRSCSCLPQDDTGYMGSGKAILRAIKKYGVSAFTKEVLSIWDTEELCLLEEARIVDENFVARKDTYNMKTGGIQGVHGEETRAKMSMVTKITNNRPEVRAKLSAAHKGKVATEETKSKISAAAKIAQNRPEVKAKIYAARNHPEIKAKMSAAAKIAQNRPEVKASRRATATKFTQLEIENLGQYRRARILLMRQQKSMGLSPESAFEVIGEQTYPRFKNFLYWWNKLP